MIRIKKSAERGHSNHGWLDSRHSFSFAEHHNPKELGFRSLRVLNEDHVSPGAGFGEHPHRDMEIISIVLSGSLAHRDSMGNGSVLNAGDVQRISAGRGIRHSERNPSFKEPVHFLQIWIQPERGGLEPGYQERHLSGEDKAGRLAKIASGNPQEGAIKIHQDVELYATVLAPGEKLSHSVDKDRHAWVQVIAGSLRVNGHALDGGDAAAISNEDKVILEAESASEAILFDLA